MKLGNASLALAFYKHTYLSYMEILHIDIYLFSCFFHGSAVPQGKQAELGHVYTVPMTTIRRPQSSVPCLCQRFPQFAPGSCFIKDDVLKVVTTIMQALISPLKDISYSCTDYRACRTTACHHLTASALYSMHDNKLQLVRLSKDIRDSKKLQVSPDSRTVKLITLDSCWRPFCYWIS